MILGILTYPLTCRPNDVIETMLKEREITFFGDVQARGYYPYYINRFFKENHISIRTKPQDEGILKNTVDFISFSYYISVYETADPKRKYQGAEISS